jgi:4'-phosphopantetheinyl transferase
MRVDWLEQKQADVPEERGWLNAHEHSRCEALRFPKRRGDWLLGRWTAKRLVAAWLGWPDRLDELRQIEIRPASSGAPEVFLPDGPAPVTISLSHRSGRALCAVCTGGSALGCDLELVEERAPAFLTDYFTPAEQTLVAAAPVAGRARLTTILWSAKESVLKALGAGLRLDARSVEVRPEFEPAAEGRWQALEAVHDGQVFPGCWREEAGFVRTLAGTTALEPKSAGSYGVRGINGRASGRWPTRGAGCGQS